MGEIVRFTNLRPSQPATVITWNLDKACQGVPSWHGLKDLCMP